jgi:Tfp pilus assembly protein PilX
VRHHRGLRSRIVHRLGQRLRGEEVDAGFALIFALLTIFIVAALSVALAGIVYNQVKPTQLQRKYVTTVNAAEAGLQVSLDQIRAARVLNPDGSYGGNISLLHCTSSTGATFVANGQSSVTTSGTTFSGTVNTTTGNIASGGTAAYNSSVAYYLTDPSSKSLAWLQSNAMACPLSLVPNYAYIQTHGIIAGQTNYNADRTQHATYQFQSTALNVYGGRLVEPYTSSPSLCLDAGINPGTSPLTMQPCLALGTSSQSFIYRKDLSIEWVGNQNSDLCVTGATNGGAATLGTCYSANASDSTYSGTYPNGSYPGGVAQQNQEFGLNDDGHFGQALPDGLAALNPAGNYGTTGSKQNNSGYCLQPGTASGTTPANSGDPLNLVSCDTDTGGAASWNPDPQVGAGIAAPLTPNGVPGSATFQFVNYAEFGRCLDINGQNVGSGNYLIAYPCKQNPDVTQITFNQKWAYAAVSGGYGTFSVNYGGTLYCLAAPTSGVYAYVTSSNCAASPTSATLWQPTGVITGDYYDSYELINQSTGTCLEASSGPSGQQTAGSDNIILATCNGSLAEKWNAPANPATATVGNVGEDSGTANGGS